MVNMGTALPDGTGSHSPMVTADRHRAARFHQSTAKVIIKTEIRVHSAVFFTIGSIATFFPVFGYLFIVTDVDGASCNRVTGQQLCVPPLLVRPIDKIHPEVFARILSSLSH